MQRYYPFFYLFFALACGALCWVVVWFFARLIWRAVAGL